jgi:hypothetical protein
MSRPFRDKEASVPAAGSISFVGHIDLPGAPLPSPNGRVLHDNLDIRIDRDGIWHYQGSPIRRKELVCLFASALRRDDTGRYWLVTPAEMAPIEVEDAPLLAVEVYQAGEGDRQIISLRTNVDEIVSVDAGHPLEVRRCPSTGDTIPYLRLDRRLEARVIRPIYYQLAALAVEAHIEDRPCLGVWSYGRLFPLGWLDEAP